MSFRSKLRVASIRNYRKDKQKSVIRFFKANKNNIKTIFSLFNSFLQSAKKAAYSAKSCPTHCKNHVNQKRTTRNKKNSRTFFVFPPTYFTKTFPSFMPSCPHYEHQPSGYQSNTYEGKPFYALTHALMPSLIRSSYNVRSPACKRAVWKIPRFSACLPRTSGADSGWPWFAPCGKETGNSSAG